MLNRIDWECLNTIEIFSVVFNRDGIEYEAIIKKDYDSNSDYTNREITCIELNGNEVELNLTDEEILEILNYV